MLEESKHASGWRPATDVSDAAKSETNACMLILFHIHNLDRYSSLFKKNNHILLNFQS